MVKSVEKIFIVGLYKSGTSWLNEILNQNPDIRGVNEIDLIRCINGVETARFSPLPPSEIIRNIFGRSAVMNLPKSFVDGGDYEAVVGQRDILGLRNGGDFYALPSERLVPLLWEAKGKHENKSSDERKRWKVFADCLIELRDWPSSENLKFCCDLALAKQKKPLLNYSEIDEREAMKMVDAVRVEREPLKLLDCISTMFEASVRGGCYHSRGQTKLRVSIC